MRSSIACSRCRRSKIKCINGGIHTTCRACESSGRECTYPTPGVGGASLRKEGGPGTAADGREVPKRPRPKKIASQPPNGASSLSRESPRAFVDALDAQILTPKVWTELFDIFQLHFSTDLPFLHPPTFLRPLRQAAPLPQSIDFATSPSTSAPKSPTPPHSSTFLLAFLALTARFHPQLVAHHSPATPSRPSNPIVASDYYASACRCLLAGSLGGGLGSLDIERTQACLMLCLHDWGMCRGVRAWVALGVAMRTAQLMGLQYDAELDDEPLSRSIPLSISVEAQQLGIKPEKLTHPKKSDAFVEQEIRRRTFWSCFIMDRYLSSGKYRPQMLSVKDLRIQLPSSEKAFLFGERVRTLLLSEELDELKHRSEDQSAGRTGVVNANDMSKSSRNGHLRVLSYNGQNQEGTEETGRWETGADEGVVSRFIRIMELYGQIVKWSCNGGRRCERFPPWDSRSDFYSLRAMLLKFRDSLPRDLSLNSQNISAHITSRTATPYTLMHTVCGLCTIILNREYVPFIPLRCSGPEGPLDPPTFSPTHYDIPANFWRDSARECYRAAREVMDLVRTCQEWNVMVETPIVGFAIYTVAFIGVYCGNFPWMDREGSMCKRNATASMPEDSSGAEAARKALEILSQIRSRLRMADGWFKTIERLHLYFARMKKDWKKNTKALEDSSATGADVSAEAYRHLSLREGGPGGGLEEYKLLEKTLKEFGSLEDDDLEMADVGITQNDHILSDASGASEAGSHYKTGAMDIGDNRVPDDPSIQQERWKAINSVAAAAANNRTETAPASVSNDNHSHSLLAPAMANAYQPHPNDFRSGYAAQQNSSAVPTPPLISPGSQQTTSTPSAPSPFLGSSYSQIQNPQQNAYPQQTYTPIQPYPPTTAQAEQNDRDPSFSQSMSHSWPQQPPSDPKETATWSSNLHPGFGGDDLAAFAAGGEMQTWAGLTAEAGGQGGWLSAVWGGGNPGM